MAPLLLGAGLGLGGGALEFLRRLLYRAWRLTHRESWSYALLGSITGFMVLFTVVAIPGLKNLTSIPSLAGVGFFSGVFSESAFTWVKSSWSNWFRPSGRPASPAIGEAEPEKKAKLCHGPERRSHMQRVSRAVLLLSCLATSATSAQQPESALYRMTLPASNEKLYVLLEQSGKVIETKDVPTGISSTSVADASGAFDMKIMLPKTKRDITLKVSGDVSDDRLQARLPEGMADGTVTLVKIKSAWECGNHGPRHVAESAAQMKTLTATSGLHALEADIA
jgi:hypothetical protein